MKTVSAQYDLYRDGKHAADKLEELGVPSGDISIISNNSDDWYGRESSGDGAGGAAASGAGVGAAVGGTGGLLAGLGLMAIPGVGPVVAAGWLAATAAGVAVGAVAGGAVGGLVGAMTDSGVPEREAHLYAEGVRRGGTVVSARVADDLAPRAQAALDSLKPVSLVEREKHYRDEGWEKFDPSAAPYTREDVERYRTRPSSTV